MLKLGNDSRGEGHKHEKQLGLAHFSRTNHIKKVIQKLHKNSNK